MNDEKDMGGQGAGRCQSHGEAEALSRLLMLSMGGMMGMEMTATRWGRFNQVRCHRFQMSQDSEGGRGRDGCKWRWGINRTHGS